MLYLAKVHETKDNRRNLKSTTLYFCLISSAKEKADVDNMQQPSVRDFFKDQSQFDAQMSKEQVRKK